MENNNPLIPAAPTPSTTSMPEFASAPAAPAPVVSPATSMPQFGQPAPQPVATPAPTAIPVTPVPAPVAEPIAPVATTPEPTPTVEPVATEPTVAEPAQETSLGEITDETAPTEPQLEAQSEVETATAEVPSSVESATTQETTPEAAPTEPATPTVSPNPTPSETITEKKKPNIKLIAILGAVALVAIIGIAVVLIMSNQKPAQNPDDVPTSSFDENLPDNSTPYDQLDKESATAFLSAVGKVNRYFPDDFLKEEDRDILTLENEAGSKLLLSYDDPNLVQDIALADETSALFREKAKKDDIELNIKNDYIITTVNPDLDCGKSCYRGISFSNKVINHYYDTFVDPMTGANVFGNEQIVFVKNDAATAERYLPVIAYLKTNFVVYSSDFVDAGDSYQLILHTLSAGVDQAATLTAPAGEIPYAIKFADVVVTLYKHTSTVVIVADYENEGVLRPIKTIPITAEEAAELI